MRAFRLKLRAAPALPLMMAAAGATALTGAAFFQAAQVEPGVTSSAGSFIRVCAALVFAAPALLSRTERAWLRRPREHASIWLWGGFGALTVTTYFASMALAGPGLAAVLGASSGAFVVALAPFLFRERFSWPIGLGVLGSLVGVALIQFRGGSAPTAAIGCALALASGFFAALAYLMLKKTAGRYSARAIALAWCACALMAHVAWFAIAPPRFPQEALAWLLLIGAGAAATIAQNATAKAYQLAPAGLVASLAYLAPVASLASDAAFFGRSLTSGQAAGAALVLAFGVALPLAHERRG